MNYWVLEPLQLLPHLPLVANVHGDVYFFASGPFVFWAIGAGACRSKGQVSSTNHTPMRYELNPFTTYNLNSDCRDMRDENRASQQYNLATAGYDNTLTQSLICCRIIRNAAPNGPNLHHLVISSLDTVVSDLEKNHLGICKLYISSGCLLITTCRLPVFLIIALLPLLGTNVKHYLGPSTPCQYSTGRAAIHRKFPAQERTSN
ncbi:hypothetical protein F5B20DRAFT_528406 [Whalleya microplaca]|nr:hypothetical protein F5B20DRAFT_528406 [Whalleya microplaca]